MPDPWGYDVMNYNGYMYGKEAAEPPKDLTKEEAVEFITILLNDGLCRQTRERYNYLMDKYKKEISDG